MMSSKRATADGDSLFKIKLIFDSDASLALPGGAIAVKNDSGRATSACEVLRDPFC